MRGLAVYPSDDMFGILSVFTIVCDCIRKWDILMGKLVVFPARTITRIQLYM